MTLAQKISDFVGPLPEDAVVPRGGPFLTPQEWREVIAALEKQSKGPQ